jgi:hypothetical protein
MIFTSFSRDAQIQRAALTPILKTIEQEETEIYQLSLLPSVH